MNENPTNHLKPNKRRPLVSAVTWLIGFLTILGLVLRLTVRDSVAGLSTLYYMTPLALIVFGAGFCFLTSRWKQKKLTSLFWSLIFVTVSAWWIQTDWSFQTRAEETKNDITILLANLARTKDLGTIASKIREIEPDIVVLVEAMVTTDADREVWKATFPEYNYSMINGGTQLLAKGKIGPPWVKALKDGSKLSRSIVTIDGVDLHCYVVDIKSTITVSREYAIEELANFTTKSTGQPALIMGDFNTPPDSVHFNILRENHVNLFETAGRGYATTWPHPIPVLALDQIWVNQNIVPIGCEHHVNFRSDHRIVVGRIQVNHEAVSARAE